MYCVEVVRKNVQCKIDIVHFLELENVRRFSQFSHFHAICSHHALDITVLCKLQILLQTMERITWAILHQIKYCAVLITHYHGKYISTM